MRHVNLFRMTKAQFKKQFPAKLKAMRTGDALTQHEVATAAGLTADWINHFEAGRRLPNAYAYYRLQRVFGNFMP